MDAIYEKLHIKGNTYFYSLKSFFSQEFNQAFSIRRCGFKSDTLLVLYKRNG